jgi:hypothetical protein
MSAPLRLCAFALLVLCSTSLAENRAGGRLPEDAVVVTAVRNPVMKSYRKMLEGAALFEERKHLAPAASLRFKLLPRKPGMPMEDVELEVAANSVAIPLKVAPDHTFALERNRTALKENAQVIPNRKAGTMTWRADVRTPGLPPNTRRLGDLRLECEVGMKAGLRRATSSSPSARFGAWPWSMASAAKSCP